MSSLSAVAFAVLADSGESKKSGPIGLAVILLLCVACYFLFKSMSKHLRKVREEFPDTDAAPQPAPPADPTAQDGEPVATQDVEAPAEETTSSE